MRRRLSCGTRSGPGADRFEGDDVGDRAGSHRDPERDTVGTTLHLRDRLPVASAASVVVGTMFYAAAQASRYLLACPSCRTR